MSDKTSHNTIGQLSDLTLGIKEPVEKTEDVLRRENEELKLQLSELKGNKSAQALTIQSKKIQTGNFLWTPTGLELLGDITLDDWQYTGEMLQLLDASIQWLIGDWAVCGEENEDTWFGNGQGDKQDRHNRYLAMVEATGYSLGSIKNMASVARQIPKEYRFAEIPYSMYKDMAGLSAGKLKTLVNTILNNSELTVRDVRDMAKKAKGLSLPEPHAIIDDDRRTAFNKIVSTLKKGNKPTQEQIEQVRAWLDEVENIVD